ncbi:hypothetical protein KEM56_006639 [Ascosphaera pollenicola]|nr:hypothetical protein KEM56_006639 [Ascosphaera pollenicola]
MKALVYADRDKPEVQTREMPQIRHVDDAIVKMKHSTICGTDLHILKGHLATCHPGTVLGHEGVGVVQAVGEGVRGFEIGDTVLLACVSKCGVCAPCRKDMPSHCETGGWILGNHIDGTQAEYVRIPHANGSMYRLPESIDPTTALTLSDAFPTGMEVGTLNAKVRPGKTLVIIGGGPVGLSALLTAKFYTPREILVVDFDDNRLKQAKAFGATQVANPKHMNADEIKETFSNGEGFDCVIEAVGNQGAFEMAQQLVAIGGDLANLGVHGKPVGLHLESLWDRNLAFKWKDVDKAYDVFGHAAENKALKVRIDFD